MTDSEEQNRSPKQQNQKIADEVKIEKENNNIENDIMSTPKKEKEEKEVVETCSNKVVVKSSKG